MTMGAQARGALLMLPVVGPLAALLVIGVAAPYLIDPGLPHRVLTPLVLTVGTGAVALCLVAAVRCRGRLRFSWSALGATAALWCAALYGSTVGWNPVTIWAVLRPLGFAAVVAGLLVSPGVRRDTREWGLLLLDGWLVGISAFLVGWVALRLTTPALTTPALTDRSAPGALYWVPLDLVVASVTTGLAIRTHGGARTPAVLLVLTALLTVTSDSTWALTVRPDGVSQFGAVEWLICLTALGTSSLTRRPDIWSTATPVPDRDPSRPRLTRLAQVAMVPGLLAAAVPGADLMTFLAAASLIVGLTVQVALTRRQHHDLWHALQGQAERLEQLVRESRDAILRLDPDGRIQFANDAVAEVFGYPPGALIGTSWYDLLLPEDRETMATQLGRLHAGQLSACRVAGRFRHGSGGWRHLESTASRSEGAGATLSVRDVSDRNRLEADLRRQASTDSLTGLFNRQAFVTLLEERLPRGDTHLLFLDLDGFKAVNDTDGHTAGDRLLREVANALRAELRPGDIAARLGGDEFAVLPAVRDLGGTQALAARLVRRIGRLSSRGGVPIAASIGVADGRHTTAEGLIRRADLAMYQAKATGGGQFLVFGGDPDQPPPHPDTGPSPAGPGTPTTRSRPDAGLPAVPDVQQDPPHPGIELATVAVPERTTTRPAWRGPDRQGAGGAARTRVIDLDSRGSAAVGDTGAASR